ncbi:NAD(P)-dependent dehydrogenase (short-subunit alcohol dehydrogenase family) [Nitrospirillum amazonense]|uniref:NAD(P)-dependent dehydrogenase (Short-subunit alcohol dehydrogenase family) n=1 Tax=Nitrospirillum amazonense TaxID=28077 RepID=A0A560KGY4_9PROT|nr:oxidoreductase [Nitrospirillum amazonense]TWB79900.1 NAD(P)-dependent dehydrogenase (short-subunit alcohol dehydrogenase family) [Nitrospirillum amazonense]
MPVRQEPIHSGFGAASTALDVIQGIDLAGKVAIVTGGYAGIGLETVRALRSAGATVVVPARDLPKAQAALAGLDGVEIGTLDLMDPASIDAFAAAFLNSGRPLHLLINNAGIMAHLLTRDARGYEAQFATNHLGHFQLTARLWPALRQAGAAGGVRVVSLSSLGHRFSPVVVEDPNFERRDYDRWSAYGQSKTANILFALGLEARAGAHGVHAFSVHPGTIVDTDLKRYMTQEELIAFGVFDAEGKAIHDPSRNMKTTAQGAATTVWCATSPQLRDHGGAYCENCDIAQLLQPGEEAAQGTPTTRRPGAVMGGVLPYAVDPAAADQLWDLSERLLGITFRPV